MREDTLGESGHAAQTAVPQLTAHRYLSEQGFKLLAVLRDLSADLPRSGASWDGE